MLLDPKHRAALVAIFAQHLPTNTVVWAYGSRVNGAAHSGSDLDLVVLPTLEYAALARCRQALQASNIPFLVQLHAWSALPATFHTEIMRQYVVFYP